MFVKIVFVGLSVCLINIFLKKQLNEFVLPVEIIFLSLTAHILIGHFQDIFSGIFEIMQETEFGEEIFVSVVKSAGICLITKFSSDICTENGNRLVADVIEFTGRIVLTVIAMPYIESVMKTAFAFVK